MSRTPTSSAPMNATGSPLTGEPAFLAVGKLRRTHGVHGEMLMEVYTDFPERLVPGTILYLDHPVDQLVLVRNRPHHAGLLLTFEGYDTPEAAAALRNRIVFVRADDRPPLAEGEYYHHQLIGLDVLSDQGEAIGVVTDIIETGASDVLVVRPARGPEVLIPVSDAFIHSIDLDQRQIIVQLISGMQAEV